MPSITPVAVIGMSCREAHELDRRRLVLEATWHALESANIAPDSLGGSGTLVFVEGDAAVGTRLSRCFGLGASAACSSALEAVRDACRSLAQGECGLVVVADADGGVAVLKPLDAAVVDGDGVLAVIRDTAIGGDAPGGLVNVVEALLGEPVPVTPASDRVPKDAQLLLTLSALSDTGLRALAGDYARLLDTTPDAEAVCRTANRSRARLVEWLAVVGATEVELAAALRRVSIGDDSRVSRGRVDRRPKVAFVFTGEGAQYLGMGGELYLAEPAFRRRMDECDEILRPHLGGSVLEVVFGADAALLDEPRVAQPALVSVELALVELWRHWGVEPDFVAGHGIGELAAAAANGSADLASTLRLAVEWARSTEAATAVDLTRFTAAVRRVVELGADTFVEIGPAPVLTGLGRHLTTSAAWVPSLQAQREDTGQIRESLGELFARGVDVDLSRLDDHRPGTRVAVPLYPFDREGLLPRCPELEIV